MDISDILRIYDSKGKLTNLITAPKEVEKHQKKYPHHFVCVWTEPKSVGAKKDVKGIFCECGKCFQLDNDLQQCKWGKEDFIKFAMSLKERVFQDE